MNRYKILDFIRKTDSVTLTHSGVERVELNGVDLYDTIHSDRLVEASAPEKFNCFYAKIDHTYKQLKFLGDKQYEDIYYITLKRNRQRERLNMRKWVLSSILKAPLPHKYMLLKNLWGFCRKKTIIMPT